MTAKEIIIDRLIRLQKVFTDKNLTKYDKLGQIAALLDESEQPLILTISEHSHVDLSPKDGSAV